MNNQDFFAAIKAGDLASVTNLLNDSPRLLEAHDENGATPLHHAALNGHRKIVRLLVDRGAHVNCLDAAFGATPTGWAIEYLRELGGVLAVEIDDLAYAIEHRDVRWVTRLLDRFPCLKEQFDERGTPLAELARNCGDETIASLFAE